MKTKLLNLFAISVISLSSLTSCNLEPDETKFQDLGFIYEYASSTSYTVRTDTCGLVWDAAASRPIEREWIGMRVKILGNIIEPEFGGAPARVKINAIGKVPFFAVERKSLVDQMSQHKQDSIRGGTGIRHYKVYITNNIMNFDYFTLSNAASQTGYSSLIFNDIESTNDLKIFNWHYTAKPNSNVLTDAVNSFDLEDVIGSAENCKIRIYYKDLDSSLESFIEFKM